jgi:hypothetical protein
MMQWALGYSAVVGARSRSASNYGRTLILSKPPRMPNSRRSSDLLLTRAVTPQRLFLSAGGDDGLCPRPCEKRSLPIIGAIHCRLTGHGMAKTSDTLS